MPRSSRDPALRAGTDQDLEHPLGGGVATIRQYPRARLIDELHLAMSPVVLGQGEHLLGGLDLRALGYACTRHVHVAGGRTAAHVFLQKREEPGLSRSPGSSPRPPPRHAPLAAFCATSVIASSHTRRMMALPG